MRTQLPEPNRVAADVVTVDQPAIAVAAVSAGAGLLFGRWASWPAADPFLAALARMAFGKQRPSSLRPCPDGQGLPQALS